MTLRSHAFLLTMAPVIFVAGCSGGAGSRLWVPQAPGEEPRAREEAVKASPPRRPAAAAQAEQPPSVSPFRPAPAGSAPTPPVARAAIPAAGAPAAAGGYTQATRYGDLFFVSGQIALDPRTNQFAADKIEDQTRQVLENIRQILEANRLTMANVVSVTVYMKDLAQFRAMDETYETFFRTALPARSVVEVARLPRGALVEISVIAGR
jgi:2-iminobutanoate/2-iminopropanoate deaminase